MIIANKTVRQRRRLRFILSVVSLCTIRTQATSSGSRVHRWSSIVSFLSRLFAEDFAGISWSLRGSEWERSLPQQHPPDEGLTVVPGVSFTFGLSPPPAVAPGPILFLISAAMVMKACSTLVAFLALVSKKGIPRESANSWTRQRGAKVRLLND